MFIIICFWKRPTEVDALVYGHVYALTSTNPLPSTVQEITLTIQEFPKLLEHASRIDRNYLNRTEYPVGDFEVSASSSKKTLWNYSDSIEALPPLSDDSFEILFLNP